MKLITLSAVSVLMLGIMITQAANAGEQKILTGVVKHITLEGGFFGIVGDDGQKYDPVNLPAEYKKDGLRIKFTAKEKEGVASIRMWGKIVEVLTIEQFTKERKMAATVQWLGHASFRIDCNGPIVYIDPWKLKKEPHDANVVLVSHAHYDHYSSDDIKKVSARDTNFIGPADVVAKYGSGQSIKPGQTIQIAGLKIIAVPAYNPSKQFHPKSSGWVGFIIEKDNLRIYYAGDTDETDEMKKLKDIDLAMLPVGGTYTMDASEAAQAVKDFKPKQAIPYHFGDIVGTVDDGKKFAQLADCDVILLKPGDSATIKK